MPIPFQGSISKGNGWMLLVVSVVLLAPSAFVEVAEITKLSVRPTDLVLRQAVVVAWLVPNQDADVAEPVEL